MNLQSDLPDLLLCDSAKGARLLDMTRFTMALPLTESPSSPLRTFSESSLSFISMAMHCSTCSLNRMRLRQELGALTLDERFNPSQQVLAQ
jgi:hypothetical protein